MRDGLQVEDARRRSDALSELAASQAPAHPVATAVPERDLTTRAGILVLSVLVALGAGPIPSVRPAAKGAPASSRILAAAAEDYWQHLVAKNLALRMRLGLGIERLPDVSFEEAEREATFARSLLARLDPVRREELTFEESLSLDILQWQAHGVAGGARYYWLGFPVTPYTSPLRVVHLAFTRYVFKDRSDLDGYLALLRQYPPFVKAVQAKLEEQARRGICLPKEEIDLALPFIKAAMGEGERSLLHVAALRLSSIDPSEAAAFQKRVADIVATEVSPALEALAESLGGPYREKAPDSVGLWQYPEGKGAYRFLVRWHTTLEVSPEEVHRFGLAEAERLNAKMKEVRERIGFKGSKAEFHRLLRTDLRFFPNTPEEVGERLLRHARAIEPGIDAFFLSKPKAPHGVKRLDAALEGSLTYGFYQPPTATDPAGTYYFNGSNLAERPLVNAAALIYHELVPGHHFQIGLQSENEALPPFRRHGSHTAYTEGWGEYASALAGEMKMYEDPYDLYGRLLMEMFLSTRLVVDTGMNHFAWPRSKAVEFMKDNVLESDVQIHTETLRYSVDMPGQALAYRMGSARLFELREKARKALGDRFDIRRFHEAVLGSGSMPLSVLERRIDALISAEGSTPRAR